MKLILALFVFLLFYVTIFISLLAQLPLVVWRRSINHMMFCAECREEALAPFVFLLFYVTIFISLLAQLPLVVWRRSINNTHMMFCAECREEARKAMKEQQHE